jgi:hypothetical protein
MDWQSLNLRPHQRGVHASGSTPVGNRLEQWLHWSFVLCSAGAVAALTAVSVARGVDRGDFFAVAVIIIVSLTLILAGSLSRSCSGTPTHTRTRDDDS